MGKKERRGEIAKLALTILIENGGDMHNRDLFDAMRSRLNLTPDELTVYDNGVAKWETHARFASTGWTKAGFIRKRKGRWYITPEGEEIAKRTPVEIQETSSRLYREWKKDRDSAEQAEIDSPDNESTTALIFETAEERAQVEIREHICKLGPYEMQDLVAALLRGMGYVTPFIAPKGPDGGTDILALPDPLGAKTPHVRVQVKHRMQQKAGNTEIASLQGNINPVREIGLFVSTSGFSPQAKQQVRAGQAHIELVDLDRFIELWIAHYPNLSEEDRAALRLRPVYFLAPE